MYTLTKKVDFCAAHHITGAGKCEKNHGHNWEANISVQMMGGLNEKGFIADVAKIKQAAYKYDHNDLNNYFEQPTTEIVAQKIADDVLDIVMDDGARIDSLYVEVHLIETKNNSATAEAHYFNDAQ